MRVLLVNQFFHPDLAATAQLVTDLAVDLAAAGAEVTAVTSRSAYLGSTARYAPRDTYRGVKILRVPSTNLGRGSIARRLSDYASFFAACAAQIALLPAQDVCITLSTPPLVSLLGAGKKVASLARTRFVYWVQDLYPDVAVRFGVLSRRSPLTLGLEALSLASLTAADAVVALGDDMAARLVAKGARADKIAVIPNWSDGDEIGQVAPAQNWFLDRHALRGKFVVLYSGNMGRGHEFATLLGAADKLSAREDLLFLFIGEGAKRAEVEAFAKGRSNVRLLPYQRREDLPFSLGSAGVCAITLSDGLEGMILPSKLYGALAARKPVLFIGPAESDVARVVERESCGGAFRHGDVPGVVAFLERLAADPAEASVMGERGRRAFDHSYARRLSTGRFVSLCAGLCAPVAEGSPA